MHPETRSVAAGARPSPFQIWLRTGRRVAPDSSPARIEFKFNPWHDPDDGRFTFARTGRYFPQGGGSFGGAGASGSWTGHERLSPRNPRNHAIHVVEEGDTLTRIAASRQGLRVSDLVWLNGLQDPNRLRIGQRLMLPTQAYLDEGRRARTNLLNLAFYRETHGGRLPPDLARVPSIEEQLNSNWRRETTNGYAFQVDLLERPRRTGGTLTLNPGQRRSRSTQAGAGGSDRLPSDHGGHYIGRQFNGPTDAFNHFAQDASFNVGEYRALENRWAAAVRNGRKVMVDIVPVYEGTSLRPSAIRVRYTIDGKPDRKYFSNQPGAK